MSSADEEETYEEEETRPLNAEEATSIATQFLTRLGNKRSLKPVKASLQEEIYIVEVGLRKKTAIVEVDAMSEEIKEYEIKTKVKESSSSFFPLTPKSILLVCGIVVISVFVSSLLGVQSFIGSIF